MSGHASPRAASVTGLSTTELDTYAQYAWLSGRVGEAIDLYTDLARIHRRSPHVHFKLGYLYLAIQDHSAAVRHFTLEIERHGDEGLDAATVRPPAEPPTMTAATKSSSVQQRAFLFCAYAGRSDALRALGEASKADLDQLFITNRGGNARQFLLTMGCLYFRFGMHQRADQCFEGCATVNGDDPEYLVEHAELRLAQRRYAIAAGMFEKCRHHCSSTSSMYHRAMIGEGSALIRQDKLQDAVILLLQAMNTLRNMIRSLLSELDSSQAYAEPATASAATVSDTTLELIHLYYQAVNLYGGLCLKKGELKAALDTYLSILQPYSTFTSILPFHLPTICITPGTKTQYGDNIDAAKLTTKTLGEAIRHLNELEWRYGPDPCLYFHRANIHRATGDFNGFVSDLSLAESMNSSFLSMYVKQEYLGDFLDLDTISWIPLKLVEGIHDALERNEYRNPPTAQAHSPTSKMIKLKGKSVASHGVQPKPRAYSEVALLAYLQERVYQTNNDDEFAQVFQIDVARRLPPSKQSAKKLGVLSLAQWEGVLFDEVYTDDATPVEEDQLVQDLIRQILASDSKHPCAHMFAGIVELEKFNVSAANRYFTDAINAVDRSTSWTQAREAGSPPSSMSHRWHQYMLQQVKYYSLIWRSVTSRVKIEMEKAVEDLNLAAAVCLGDQVNGSDEPLLVIQRTLIMLLNGHLKSAYKLLRQLKKSLRLARRDRAKSRLGGGSDVSEVIDMFSNAGLNTFHLLSVEVLKESLLVGSAHRFDGIEHRRTQSEHDSEREGRDRAQDETDEREEEAAAISMVKYALTKKATPQTEMLDKFYESGLLKLAMTGSISQVIPFFQAILSMDEGYLPPTNFASLEIFKCKEQDFMEEKLFNCFLRLGKRAKWLEKKIRWKFEALIDSNLAHSYLPTDMETLWHRARLLQDQRNFASAISDLTDCLQLMVPHYAWEKGKKGEKAIFNNETKRTQWLQLQLERGMLHMELQEWDKAIDDLTMVIVQSGKKNPGLQASAYDARSSCLVRFKRYGHAIQDLQYLLALSKDAKKSKKAAVEEIRRREERLLNCILVGNLYCQLAVDQLKASSALARKASVTMNPLAMKQAQAAHLNMGFITRAGEFYDEAEAMIPDHFLVHYFRGRMYAISGQSQMAARSLTNCLKLHMMFLPALFLRGCVYAQENLFVLALADYYRVRHRSSAYPNLHTSIGFCHLERGSLTKAVESFTEAILQRADDTDALYMRGCALQELLVLENAQKDFHHVVTLKPEYCRAYYQRAVCSLLLKDYRGALRDVNTVVQLQPEWKDAWILHGYTCFCCESYDRAVFSYGSAIALPDLVEGSTTDKSRQRESALFLYRAICYMQCGKFSAALTDLELALKRDNENYVAFIARAYCLSRCGDRTRAAQTLAHCLPHHKQIKLPPAMEVLDSERAKELVRKDAMGDISPFSQPIGYPGTGSQEPKRYPAISATPDKLFRSRKAQRDAEPKQSIRPISLLLGDRRASSASVGSEHRRSFISNSLERRTSTQSAASSPQKELPARKSRLFSTLPMLPTAVDSAAELEKLRAKHLRAKFLRAMKKITFQYRVLKALEKATSAKYKRSQQMTRALTETLQPTSKVGWPKGTLTTRILVWAFNAFGIHHIQDRKVDDALMAFTLAIQAHPLHCDTHFNRGNVYLQIDVLHSAVSGYQDAIEVDDDCYRAHNNMGVAYYKMKQYDEAEDAFSTGLHHVQHATERAVLLYNLGVTFQALEKSDEALDFYQQAIALDGSRTEFFNNRSAILHYQMRYAVALEDYNRALRLQHQPTQDVESHQSIEHSGNDFAARLNRAQLFIAMGNCTLATRDLKIVLHALTEMKDQATSQQQRLDHTGNALSLSTAGTAAKIETLDADIQLATELLAFSRKWHTAMRIAVKDFLFALHALPCFAVYEFSPMFGPELVRLQEREAELMYANDFEEVSTEIDQLQLMPLPIQDNSFFNFERDFSHWIVAEGYYDENHEADDEEQDAVRTIKREQWQKKYGVDVRNALQCAREGRSQEASRWLLRAHYKTSLDSHDEYLLLTWRIQVTLNDLDNESDYGLSKAIVVLREFLDERRTQEEVALDEELEDGPATAKARNRPQLHSIDDADDEQEGEAEWRAQRRVIRADLYTLIGTLYQLNGQVVEAKATFHPSK